VLDTIRGYAKDDPLFWKPSALLETLVAEKRTLADLNNA
jgi:hypothetical protein